MIERQPSWRIFEVRALLEDVCRTMAGRILAQQVAVEIDAPIRMTFSADTEMLQHAVTNLVLNALDEMTHGGQLLITAVRTPRGLELEVADSGPGVRDQDRRRIFDPWFSTKQGAEGMGLAVVHRIARMHGGDVRVASCAQGGAAFTIRLPNRAMDAAA
jgi:signal transduction histidine kinase